ncbi:MAG: MinD/ParA family protein [Selenomonas sp.]|nr:MinD/ParA family protein [Selenomonadales bacterium]MDD7763182.1 MinD/ParA family protein [Selenomonadales bacterium]MDY5717831.1 MinD/ParA family protein [Selenomonas sp.]
MQDQATRLRQLVGDKTEYKTLVTEDNSASLRAGAKVLAVTSGKGGVGKTNITVNLAIALKRAGKKVLVIDADLGMANVDVVLGSRSHKHLLNLLEDGVELNNVLINGPYGVKYISGGSGIEKAIDFSMEQRQLLMQKLAACGSQADIILLDTGAGLGKNVMDFVLAADEVLLITTPEPTALTDAYAMMKAYSMYAKEKNLRLIINRVYDEQESKDVAAKLKQTAERFLQMPIDCLGYVYEDSAVMRSVRQQTPFLVANANCTAAKCIEALAASLLYGREMTVKRGWKGFLQEIFHFPR